MPLPCPDCAVPLPDPVGQACPACALPLRGAAAARLYEIDTSLAALRAEREQVLALLRAARSRVVDGVPLQVPRSPQRVLLGLGALLLLVATSVFLAVVWLLIGVVGQVAVVAGATAGAGAASVETARRGLGSTSTTLAWLAAGLTVMAVQGGRVLGLPGLAALSAEAAVALGAALGAVLAAAAARGSGSAVFAGQAVGASALVLPSLLVALGAEPAALVAAGAAWALLALVVGRTRPGLLHAGTAGPVALVCEALGLAVVLVSVLAGLLAAGLAPPGPGLRAAVVVLAVTVAVQQACARLAPGGLPVAAAGVGTAGALATWRVAELAADRTAVSVPAAVTAVGVLAWLAAAALLPARRRTATAWAGAAGAGAGLLLGHALLREDWGSACALSLGLAAAAATAGALHRAEPRVAAVALPVSAAAVLTGLGSGLVAAGAPALGVVLAAGAACAVVALLAACAQEEPEEPGLGAVALTGLAGALAGTAWVPAPSLTAAALLAAGAVLALGYACLPRRGLVAPLGVVLASAASWTLLADRGVDLLEVYTLPVAALLLVVGLVRRAREPQAPSWTTVGPAAALALVPSAQVAAADPGSLRVLLVLAAGCGVALVGVRLHLRALVLPAGLVVAELALVQLGQAALHLPRWLVLATLGGLLLGAGASYEARVQQARAAGDWVRALR